MTKSERVFNALKALNDLENEPIGIAFPEGANRSDPVIVAPVLAANKILGVYGDLIKSVADAGGNLAELSKAGELTARDARPAAIKLSPEEAACMVARGIAKRTRGLFVETPRLYPRAISSTRL